MVGSQGGVYSSQWDTPVGVGIARHMNRKIVAHSKGVPHSKENTSP